MKSPVNSLQVTTCCRFEITLGQHTWISWLVHYQASSGHVEELIQPFKSAETPKTWRLELPTPPPGDQVVWTDPARPLCNCSNNRINSELGSGLFSSSITTKWGQLRLRWLHVLAVAVMGKRIYILKTIINHSVACVIMRGFIFSPGYELEWGFKQKADLVKEVEGKHNGRSSEGNSEQKQKTVRGVLLPSLILSKDSLHFSVLRCELRHVWAALSGASWKADHRRSSSSETRQTSSDRTSADRSLVFVIRRRFSVSLICWCSDDEHSFGPEVAPLSSFRPSTLHSE